MIIFLATDHAGFELKEKIKIFLQQNGHEIHDMGALAMDAQDDYPDFIIPAAEKVAATSGSRGIIFGASGQGEAIAANKVRGVRAAVFYGGPLEIITLSREHNTANVLSLGARFLTEKTARDAISLWLSTKDAHEPRHQRRIGKILDYEKKKSTMDTNSSSF